MKILVTGGTGFIGRVLLGHLVETGAEVTAIVRNSAGLEHRLVKAVEADLLSGPFDRIRAGQWDVLLHMGDLIPGKASGSFIENCIACTNLVEHLVGLGAVRKVIYTSTLDVYGRPAYLPVDEDHPIRPRTYYGASKACNEILLSAASRISSVPLIVLRLSQVYGPGDAPIKAIPLFVERVKRGEPIVVYGDGTDRRDYLYIADAARAIGLALNSDKAGVYNVATGTSYSLNEVLAALEDILGRRLEVLFRDRRQEKVAMAMDIRKISNSLGYSPEYDIRAGLHEYCREEGCLAE